MSTELALHSESIAEELARREAVIRKADEVRFIIAGRELAAIRDKKLYQESHRTFDKYVEAVWDFSSGHAYRMIDAAELADKISPRGEIHLTNEMQARELLKAPNLEVAQQSWDAAVDDANGGMPKASAIARKVTAKTEEIIDAEHELVDPSIPDRNASARMDAAVKAFHHAALRLQKCREEVMSSVEEKSRTSPAFQSRKKGWERDMIKPERLQSLVDEAAGIVSKWEGNRKQVDASEGGADRKELAVEMTLSEALEKARKHVQ